MNDTGIPGVSIAPPNMSYKMPNYWLQICQSDPALISFFRVSVLLVVVVANLPSAIAAEEYSAVEELMFTGDPRPSVETLSIWNRNIPWKSSTTDPTLLTEIRSATSEINLSLQRSPFKLVEAKDTPTALFIEFVPHEKLVSLQGKNSTYRPGRVGHTVTIKRGDGSIGVALVFVANNLSDRMRGYVLRHELMHALGVPKHTTYVFDSIMRRNWRRSAAPPNLLGFDRKLIDFVYMNLKSGDSKQDTRRAFDRAWGKPTQ